MKKVFRPLVTVISTLFLAFVIVGQSSEVRTDGLKSAVTIRRDARSIPYIEAANDADLYFAQGYTTASDRLWQMDLLRRVARGETAEIFGKQTLEEDKRWRRFGFAKIAEESLAYLQPELRGALDAYARGVNAYISTLDEKTLPLEFKILQYRPREWKPEDTMVIGKILADALSSTWRQDLMLASLKKMPADKYRDLTNRVTPYDVVLFGKDDAEAKTAATAVGLTVSDDLLEAAARDEAVRERSLQRIGFYAEELAASNNWVISGKRTADGKAMLANDPHLLPATPGIWYLTHLSTPTMRVSGVTFPGVPGIVLGHNANIAWGATNVGPDVQDLYEEAFDAEGKYKTASGPQAPKIRKEIINVRTNPLKTETEAVAFEVVETRNGPIVVEEYGKKYSLRWTALDPENNEFEAFFLLNRAASWDTFTKALRTYGGSMQNFVYADVKGNIGWYAAGKVPIRRTGEGDVPYSGSGTDGDWTGYIPFEELPHLYNPTEGFIVTANQRIIGTSYKYPQLGRDAAMPWRARRLYELLKADPKVTLDDARDFQHDAFSIPHNNLAKAIVKASAASAHTLAVLKNWDGRMTPESTGALLANEIRNCVAAWIATDNTPASMAMIRERILDRAVAEDLKRWLPRGFASFGELMMTCDTDTQKSLSDPKRLGPDPAKWTWGAVTKSRFPHPLASVPFIGAQFATPSEPIAGSGQSPNVGSFVSMRHIASPGNWDATRHVIPMGQSGDARSEHYKDQFEAWRSGAPAVFPFSEKAVKEAERSVLKLVPVER